MPRRSSRRSSLARFLDAAQHPVYVLDDRRRIIYCNQALADWLGTDLESILGRVCVYHSTPPRRDQTPSVDGLCPPPQAFGGTRCSGSVATSNGTSSVLRGAEFLPLQTPDGAWHVLAVVGSCDQTGTDVPLPTPAACTAAQLHDQLWRMRGELAALFQIDQLIGNSASIRRVREQVTLAAKSQARVLVMGSPGSGREQVARTIHYSHSGQNSAPLVPLACPLLDAELLQTTVDAFLRRCAELVTEHNPALLLLEVDQLTADAQRELMGFLAIEELELRTLGTARRPLLELAKEETFIDELAHQLSTLVITLPPLAERIEDVPGLAQYFVELWNARGGSQLAGFDRGAVDQLTAYSWPGNVDELRDSVTRACRHAKGTLLTSADLPRHLHLAMDAALYPPAEEPKIELDGVLEGVERELLARALHEARGNRAEAARRLGISRNRLLRRIDFFKLT